MNALDFEAKVLAAACRMANKGWSIQVGCFGEADEQSCCPLTAYLLEEIGPDIFGYDGLIDLDIMDKYLESINVPPLASEAFWEGLDLTPYYSFDPEEAWYQAGQRTRTKLIELGLLHVSR